MKAEYVHSSVWPASRGVVEAIHDKEEPSVNKTHRSRLAGIVGLALVLSLVLSTAFGQREFEGVEINVLTILEPVSHALSNPELMNRFYEETGIRVNVEMLSGDPMRDKILTESVARTGALDVVRTGPDKIEEYVTAGWIVPLNTFVERFEFQEDLADFPQAVLESHSLFMPDTETVWTIPINANLQLLVYREDFFNDPAEQAAFRAEYGYDLRPPETTRELLDAARFFTRDTNGDGQTDLFGFWDRLTMTVPAATVSLRQLWTWGELVFDAEGNIAIESERVADSLQWYKELYGLMPDGVLPGAFTLQLAMWSAGEVAMTYAYIDGTANLMNPELNQQYHAVTGAKIVPRNEESGLAHGKTMLGGGGFSVHRDSRNPEAAARFILWLFSEDVLGDYIAAGGNPPRAAFFQHPATLADPVWNRINPVWLEALEVTAMSRPDDVRILEELGVMLHDVLFEDVDPNTAVQRAARAAQTVVDRTR